MHSKIFIKLYVVLFVIDLALWGLHTSATRASGFALINLVALFVVLIQERHAFHKKKGGTKRVLFTPDVFGFISLGVGVLGATWQASCTSLFVDANKWLVAALIAGLFYVLSVWVFKMYDHKRIGHVPHIRIITWLITALFVYLMSSRVLPINIRQQGVDDTKGWWSSLTTSVRSIGDDEEIIDLDDIEEETITIGERNIVADLLAKDDTEEDKDNVEVRRGTDTLFDVTGTTTSLTFGNFLPVLVDTYDLVVPTAPYTFTHISVDSELYDAFATARAYTMIGSATRPDQVIQCRHLMVLIGLAEDWDITYTAANVFDIFWQYAVDEGYTTNGCTNPLQVATFADLP